MKVQNPHEIPTEKIQKTLNRVSIIPTGEIQILITQVGYADPAYFKKRFRLSPWQHKGNLILTPLELIFIGRKKHLLIRSSEIHAVQPFKARVGVLGSYQFCEIVYGEPKESAIFIGYADAGIAYELEAPSLKLIQILRTWFNPMKNSHY